ncbi:methionine--tRNA ligase [Rubrobacter marinus]|uniref:Methionine--tRNA ligase n=1 Tax=Rubrobacter marinus TaxID=2653852 RepID=A0A6G8Q173_9ACTN|nr:methionine--tRNA ligase [Rubrobacter marinus]
MVFVGGTDEHGVPITLTAEREGKTPREVVDHWYAHMKETFDRFGVSFDNFSRTSTPLHAANTQLFYEKLKEGGYVSEAESKQMYSPTEGRFLPDRYVEGTCPVCGYKEARGDQCDNCGSWYEAYELIEPHSKITGGPVEVRETTHLYLDLPKFTDRLKAWVSGQDHWRDSVRNFVLGMIGGGLERRPITRDIAWGVPVPEPGFEDKRFYVWFDAPIGYVSSTMEWAENVGEPDRWREYWQEGDTKLVHFIGKDNTVFHAVVWPAMLMGVGEGGDEPYVLPYDVAANEFMNLEVVVDGEPRAMQMSTSRNLAVWLHEALDRFPADLLRFYLASILPETGDVVFSWREFQSRVNSDLIGTLGNYVNRTLSFTEKYFDGSLPRPENLSDEAREVFEDFKELEARYERRMYAQRPRDAFGSFSRWGGAPTASSTPRPLEEPQGGPGRGPRRPLRLRGPARLYRLPRLALRPRSDGDAPGLLRRPDHPRLGPRPAPRGLRRLGRQAPLQEGRGRRGGGRRGEAGERGQGLGGGPPRIRPLPPAVHAGREDEDRQPGDGDGAEGRPQPEDLREPADDHGPEQKPAVAQGRDDRDCRPRALRREVPRDGEGDRHHGGEGDPDQEEPQDDEGGLRGRERQRHARRREETGARQRAAVAQPVHRPGGPEAARGHRGVEDGDARGAEERGEGEPIAQVDPGPVLHLPLGEEAKGGDRGDEQERQVGEQPARGLVPFA